MGKRQVNTQIATRKGAAKQGASLCFIVYGQCGWVVFTQGKLAISDIGITRAAITLTALGRQNDVDAGGGSQQILVGGAFKTELFSVSGSQFNSVSIHVLFGLQKMPPERL
jgi:hypothetical protein